MNKADMIDQVAAHTGWQKSEATKALEAVIECIEGSLKSGEEVALKGFGTFKVSKRKARDGRNPATGEAVKIAAKNVMSFKPHKTLKDMIA